MSALLNCGSVMLGFSAAKKAAVTGVPATSPLPALTGTVAGIEKPKPFLVLQPGTLHCAALKLGVVQPIDSKPSVRTKFSEADRPTKAPKVPHVSLTMRAPRGLAWSEEVPYCS